ncbi:MAG: hypothetical protein H6736_16445 [Alphaproteobacteria bacterium]|nr:hypothetical protein [Alphaproteobacteria bacterium]MCB9693404.1 hypothetical protein [Alphaproteobacteria bacterium]
MIMLTLSVAAAAPCEQPLTEEGLRDIVKRARSAIEEGDVAAHLKASDELESRVPCLVEQLPRRVWADYLVTATLVKHLDKAADWNQPLSVALDLVPDHPDVPRFLLDDYRPPSPPVGQARKIPAGVVFVLDGKVVLDKVPPLEGIHIVQTVRENVWHSMFLRDQPVPEDFFGAPEERPDPTDTPESTPSFGVASVSVGYGSWTQDGLVARVEDRAESGPAFGLSSHGQQGFAGPIGMFWKADMAFQVAGDPAGSKSRPVPFGDAFLGLALTTPVAVWVGGGATTVRVQEVTASGPVERPLLVPHYLLGAAFHTAGSVPLDAVLGGGWGPALSGGSEVGGWGSHAFARFGVTPVLFGGPGLRVGLQADWSRSTLGDSILPLSEREPLSTAHAWRTAIDVGVRW